MQQGIVQDYPPLCDAKGSMTAQFVSLFSIPRTWSLNVANRSIQSFFGPPLRRLSVEAMTIEYVRYYLCTPILFSRSSSIKVSLAGFQSTGKLFGMTPFEPLARALPDMPTFCSAKYRSVQMRPFVRGNRSSTGHRHRQHHCVMDYSVT